MDTFDIQRQFLQFYQNNGFQNLPRGSLLDPMVPMTFVGSVGLSQIETAIEKGEDHSGERYATVQPCFRHFDIQKVGQSPVHLSLFQMAGAFSFDTVRRDDTLGKIRDFLVNILGFKQDRLWVTFFSGGWVDGYYFETDTPTADTWRKLSVPPAQIVPMGVDGSFWKQSGGLEGKDQYRKCGPTTEIFYDQGAQHCCNPECGLDCDCERFIEIANILFIHQYIDQSTGSLHPLITPFDETVFGIERVAMTLSDKPTVFDLPCILPLVEFIQTYAAKAQSNTPHSARIIADHIRALLFLTADNAPPPGKGGQARIMRMLTRGIMAQQQVLGINDPTFLPSLIEATYGLYQRHYPHLQYGITPLQSYFSTEQTRFDQTLTKAYRRLHRMIKRNGYAISGEQAVDLVKNYGVPYPLLETVLDQQNIILNKHEYKLAFNRWKQTPVKP